MVDFRILDFIGKVQKLDFTDFNSTWDCFLLKFLLDDFLDCRDLRISLLVTITIEVPNFPARPVLRLNGCKFRFRLVIGSWLRVWCCQRRFHVRQRLSPPTSDLILPRNDFITESPVVPAINRAKRQRCNHPRWVFRLHVGCFFWYGRTLQRKCLD